ncbi:MAG: magnesium transporter [Phycisphaerae bacterium]|jgi:magnesium transporter
MVDDALSHAELMEAWPALSVGEKLEGFTILSRAEAEELFQGLPARDQADLLGSLSPSERRLWLRLLAPDDAADVIQAAADESREELLALLDESTRREVSALLAYQEDEAGGLMTTQYARLRPDMRVDEAITYLRRQTRTIENVYYPYVLDSQQHLLGVVSLRELLRAPGDKSIREVMRTDVVTVDEEMDQEAVAKLFAEHDLTVMPVVDAERRIKGIVTVDDIVDVVREEATEDIQKIGGVQALDAPYLQTGFAEIIRKRAVWLVVLFLGQTLTANVMEHYESELATAAVLMIFIPLIVSSGGNSGSQAATLVVRAMALGEVKLREWWRVASREVVVGLFLGLLLAGLGLTRTVLWHLLGWGNYTDHYFQVALTVGGSLVVVVLWGTLVGSMLPLGLRRLGLDPASASTPFVATLCDVTGLIIYFTVASVMLHGSLLA